jgi:hypothetical protein
LTPPVAAASVAAMQVLIAALILFIAVGAFYQFVP